MLKITILVLVALALVYLVYLFTFQKDRINNKTLQEQKDSPVLYPNRTLGEFSFLGAPFVFNYPLATNEASSIEKVSEENFIVRINHDYKNKDSGQTKSVSEINVILKKNGEEHIRVATNKNGVEYNMNEQDKNIMIKFFGLLSDNQQVVEIHFDRAEYRDIIIDTFDFIR